MKRAKSRFEPLKDIADDDDAAGPPLKKRKSSIRVDRAGPGEHKMDFQTPHPTLESQSQTFKLPSSSPKPSPRALSPVPGPLRSSTHSKHELENAPSQARISIDPDASSAPWTRHPGSKPLASMMRKAGARKSRPRTGRHPSRSHSRSSSNSNSNPPSNVSSRANSKEPKARVPKSTNAHPKHESKLKHAHSLSSLDYTKTTMSITTTTTANQNHKPKSSSKRSSISKENLLPLASPFVSRASSPVDHQSKAHIPTQNPPDNTDPPNKRQHRQKSSARSGVLNDVTVNPNLPSTAAPSLQAAAIVNPQSSRPWHHHNVRHSFDERANPKKINLTETTAQRKTRSSGKAKAKPSSEKFVYAHAEIKAPPQEKDKDNVNRERERERRPSAPSSLHLPKQFRQTQLSVLGPGRGGSGTSTNALTARGKVKSQSISGVHVFLDELRRQGEDVRTHGVPPTPSSISVKAEQTVQPTAERGESKFESDKRKPLPARFLHMSMSMDDLHAPVQAQAQAHVGGGKNHRGDLKLHGDGEDDEDERTAWMRARANVDFNRPPSQMDVAPRGGGVGYADFEETFFTSEEEELDDDDAEEDEDEDEEEEDEDADDANANANLNANADTHKQHRKAAQDPSLSSDELWLRDNLDMVVQNGFGFGMRNMRGGRHHGGVQVQGLLGRAFGDDDDGAFGDDNDWIALDQVRFGEDALGVSTPAKDAVSGGLVVVKADKGKLRDEEGEGEADMELTGSAASISVSVTSVATARRIGDGDEGHGQEHDQREGEEEVSWITDSIISPPVGYALRKAREAKEDPCSIFNTNYGESSSSSTLEGPSCQCDAVQANHELEDEGSSGCNESYHDPEDEDSSEARVWGDGRSSSSSSGRSDRTAAGKGVVVGVTTTTTATTAVAAATRTRSGTIVPANSSKGVGSGIGNASRRSTTSPVALGARRTRSGTIVGPLPPAPPPVYALPPPPPPTPPPPHSSVMAADATASAHHHHGGHARVGAAPVRTRSGTIVASASVPRAASAGSGAGRMRSGSVVMARSGSATSAQGVVDPLQQQHHEYLHRDRPQDAVDVDRGEGGEVEGEEEAPVECYIDSLYVPAGATAAGASSSPDPIDFLRFARIAEAEDEDDDWRAVRPVTKGKEISKPDSLKENLNPNTITHSKAQRGRGALRGLGRWLGRGRGGAGAAKKTKATGGKKGMEARFVGAPSGGGGRDEDDEDENALGDVEDSSEDELGLWN
ncbi:hypothetical protein BDN70DRAFT_990960 [Pholiota conissans]|uniref:Uncharacterized protein n=1 Tax=Pholiota conissans TaxID=109636 RepID=A0A9P6D4F9_9AGAR|nr:hypothetical protein BDN70DRAFT_990960 [Pholiota conissans]